MVGKEKYNLHSIENDAEHGKSMGVFLPFFYMYFIFIVTLAHGFSRATIASNGRLGGLLSVQCKVR